MVTTITYFDLYAHIHSVHVLYLLFLVEVGVILYILMTGEMPWSSLVSLEVLVETAEVVMATLFWKGGDTPWWKRGNIYLIDGTTAHCTKSGGFSRYFSCEDMKMLLFPFEQKGVGGVGCSTSPAFRTAKKTRNL